MKISKTLIKRFAFLTGFFLVLATFFLGFGAASAFFSQVNSSMESEANSAAGIAAQTYSQGNLVALRGSLDSLARANTWYEASFANADGDKLWTTKHFDSFVTPSKIEMFVWKIASKISGISSKNPIIVTKYRDVNDANGEIFGKIVFVKNLVDPWRKFLINCLTVGTCILVIWIIFIFLCWFVSQKTLRLITFLIEDLKLEATKINLNLDSLPEKDEIQNIRMWFRDLTASWVEARTKLVASKRDAALAQMIQMLAHDVRKPFSMLKTGLNLSDPNKFKSNLAFLVSEVDRATKSVDGMLTDVMEIGSTSTELIQEPVSPESLIESTLGEVFRVYPKSKIALSYDLKHAAMVNVHVKKVSRIFSNIVGNAVQAMNYSGSMWFKTKMDGDFVEFCIGNAGSVIPPESLVKLFEAFFTSGKKGGTGLGLAIAQKVVQAHGGKIWCESSKTPDHPDGKVEFFFTLPVAKEAELLTTANLPKHSDEITQIIALMGQASNSKSDSEFNKSEGLLHEEVVQRARELSRPLGLLIVDDESIYRSALAGWIQESAVLTQLCKIHHATGSIEAFDILKNQTIDLIITDIDMGPKSLSGFDLVKQLRTSYDFKGLIFVHSNRIVPDDHRRAGDLGADGFLPKPMAKGQLFKLLLQTIQTLSPFDELPTSALDPMGPAETNPVQGTPDKSSPYHLIAIIDDEDIFRDQWPAFLKAFETVCYASAEDFVKDWDQVSGKLVAVLTDKYLGPGMDGIKLGTMVRQKAPDLAIILSTSDLGVKNDSNIFDMIVDKDAFEEAPKITKYLKDKTKDENLQALMGKTIRAFDSHARDLGESPDFTSIIDSHILSWELVLKDLDQTTKAKLKESMAKTEKEKLKHDIKASVTRFKILLRYLDQGEMDSCGVLNSLKSRVADAAQL
jgi:signal transduction histidine kinase/CheY-like chemotaxis protein